MNPAASGEATAALRQRLGAAREVLQSPGGRLATSETGDVLEVLVGLVESVRGRRDLSGVWLLLTALAGSMPDAARVRAAARALVLQEPENGALWLLGDVAASAMRSGHATARLRVATERPLIDVDRTARSDFLTGIQRVVRGVVAEWNKRHDVEFVAWTQRGGAYRSLHPEELARLLQREVGEYDAAAQTTRADGGEIVVPWRVPVVLTEVPAPVSSDRLAAAAELAHVSVRLVGYDCIPVASAELVPATEPERFGRYLELVKFSDRLAGISESAAEEFRGFGAALAAQGLTGPTVTAQPLPNSSPVLGADEDNPPRHERPVVVCVGSIGRRKNQTALVEAAETLWRDGLDFELRLFGHLGGERSPLVDLVPELQAAGRPLVVESGVSDARIADTLAHARCLVFPSLHEGFGLPVVEALSHGVPVITSAFGSMREVAEGQGGLLVDPTDVDALATAMRAVLTDDELDRRLRREARARPVRGWAEYADDLWEALLA